MNNEGLYLAKGGEYFTDADLAKVAIANGEEWTPDYWKKCKGILRPVNPTVSFYLANGRRIKAILLYKETVGCSMGEAKDAVEEIEKKMMNGEWEHGVI